MSDDLFNPFQQNREPYFSFPDVPPTASLTFEKLSLQNFETFCHLFEKDASPFVDARFKSYDGAKEYAEYLVAYGAYSPKHGGQDWLFTWQGEWAGIVHLYDLSLETVAQNNERAWIGIALQQRFRGKGIALQTFRYFIGYIFRFYPAINFLHAVTEKENIRSQTLLTRCGFILDTAARPPQYRYYILKRSNEQDIEA